MRIKRLKAFTLVEMLLVVAVIVLLIAFLLPGLRNAREAARGNTCSTNLSYIHGAAMQYTLANSTMFPRSENWVGSKWWDINSVRNGKLYSYMGQNENSYICPLFISTPRSKWITAYDWGGMNNYQNYTAAFTYTLNEYMSTGDRVNNTGWNGKPPIRKLQQADEPQKLAWFTEENPWTIPGWSGHPINNGAFGIGGYSSGSVDCLATFHQPNSSNLDDGSANVLFADGHVGLAHLTETKIVGTPRRYKPVGAP